MLNMKTSFYWRICWGVVTPGIMIMVFVYGLIATDALVYGETYTYPDEAYREYCLIICYKHRYLIFFYYVYKN